jgi:Mg2+-importing ATPase
MFHSAWFVVSLLTELVALLVLRTQGPCWASRPSTLLWAATASVAAAALALPFLPALGALLGLPPLPPALLAALLLVVLAYAACTEAAKRRFFRPRAPRLRG